MEKEEPYFDKNGNEIKEFDLLKFFHFKGVNDQGRGRKKYYMYKWVRIEESNGKLYYKALHLNDPESAFYLRATMDSERVIKDAEIVQSVNGDRYISK